MARGAAEKIEKGVVFRLGALGALAAVILVFSMNPPRALAGVSASGLFAPGQGKPQRVATVVSEEPDGVVLSLDIPQVSWTSGSGYAYPSIPGFGLLSESGRPVLPVRIERVAIPRGAEPRLTILALSSFETPSGLVGPAQSWMPIVAGSDDRVPLNVEDPMVYGSDDPWPSRDPVRLGHVGAFREQAFVELIVTPVLHKPASRSSLTYRSVNVRIDFGFVALRSAPSADPFFEDLYDLGLVNADQGRSFRGERTLPAPGGRVGSPAGPPPGAPGSSTTDAAAAGQTDAGRPVGARASVAAGSPDDSLTPLSPKYKLTVNRDAIYRLDVSWVTANAPGLLTQNSSKFRLECQGQPIPITVSDADGTFNGTDTIEFYGQALTWDLLDLDDWNHGDYTDDNVYWLYADSAGGPRAPTRTGLPTSGYAIALDFSETIHHETDTRFLGQVPTDPVDHWYADPPLAASGSAANFSFTVNTPGLSTDTAAASIKVAFLGDNYVNNYHRTTINVNATQVSGPYDWDGFVERVQGQDNGPANFAQSLLNDGTPANASVTVSLPLGRTVNSTPITRDTLFMNWIEITYGRKFRVDADVDGDGTVTDDQRLIFSVPNQNTQIHITGFAQGVSSIYEITKTISGTPLVDPVRITNAARAGAAAPFQFDFQIAKDTTLPVGVLRRFAVAAITAAANTGDLVPAAVKTDVASNLHAPAAGVDWLVIANASLMPASGAWSQLVARRASQGLRVANQAQGGFVDVEDVYDEFSYGISDPQAIRDFIAYVYANWPRIDPSVAVRYVLLVGDGSYDYKNGNGYPQNKNLLSPYMRSVADSSILGYMSDETYFSAVVGNDAVPDVLLGRWPVHGTAETNAVAQKILDYESAPSSPPWQPWQYDTVFIADDADITFETIQDQQANDYLIPPHTYHRVYEGQIKAQFPPGTPPCTIAAEANDRIIRQINGQVEAGRDIGPGASVLSYVGHGSWQNWGDNCSFILNASAPAPPNDDVDKLSNGSPGSKFPFVLVADCLSGGFAATNRISSTDLTYALGDDYLVTANKGAVGVLAPSHLTFSVGHTTVENTFFGEAYGPKKTRSVGKIMTVMQLEFARTGDIVTLRSYTLLTDPALNLAIPAPRVPTNVVAAPGNHQVTVSWTASSEATSYNVYRATTPSGPYTKVATVSAGPYVSTNLANCTTYYFSLASVNSGFEGAWSGFNDGCGTGGSCVRATPLNPSAPAAPSGLTATDNETGGSVSLQWAANPAGDDVESYKVFWGTSPGALTQSVSGIAGTSFLVTGLANGTTYYFSLSATNCSRGEGPRPAPVSVVPHRIEGIKPPNSVGDLKVFRFPDPGDHIDDARLVWTPPATNIYGQPLAAPGATLASQEIYSGTTPNFTVDAAHRLATVSGATSSYIHENGFGDAGNHYYVIVAVDSNGNRSGIRDELPQGIEQLTVRRSGGNLILSWPAVTLDVDGRKTLISSYSLYGRATAFRRADVAAPLLIQGGITATTVTLPIPAGTQFHYSVIVIDNRGALSPW